MEFVVYNNKKYYIQKNSLALIALGIKDLNEIKGLSKLENLKSLNLYNNELKKIEVLENLQDLEIIILDHNNISKIENINNYHNLKVLRLHGNKIEQISGLEKYENIYELDLSENHITEIKGLSSLRNLKTLHLWANSIKEIKGLDGLLNLNELYLNRNSISEIKNLEHLIKLKLLDLSCNKIDLIKSLIHLERLDALNLSNNLIIDITGLENLQKLTNLDLSNNLITEIENIEKLSNLMYLNLENNQIKEIQGLGSLNNLKELHFRDNPIRNNYERYLTEKTIDANEFFKYYKNQKVEEIFILNYFNKAESFGGAIQDLISDLNRIEDLEKFIDIGTHREELEIKAKQNTVFLFEPPLRINLNKKERRDRLDFHLFQLHSLKGIKSLRVDKMGHFLFFINHFWDNDLIQNNRVLTYKNFESRVVSKLDELLDLSLKIHSSYSFFYKPDIMIFPENSIPYNYLEKLIKLSKNHEIIIIGGLEHKNLGSRYINQSFIIDKGKIGYQVKQTPVIIFDKINNKTLKENIECIRIPKIKVFESTIGNIAIFICKDFLRLYEVIPNWAQRNSVDYIFVPSFTNKLLPFYGKILEIFNKKDSKDLTLIFNSMGEYGGSELFSISEISRIEESFRLNVRDNVGETIVLRPIFVKRNVKTTTHFKYPSKNIYDIEEFIEYVMTKNPTIETIDTIPVLTTATGASIIRSVKNYMGNSGEFINIENDIGFLKKNNNKLTHCPFCGHEFCNYDFHISGYCSVSPVADYKECERWTELSETDIEKHGKESWVQCQTDDAGGSCIDYEHEERCFEWRRFRNKKTIN